MLSCVLNSQISTYVNPRMYDGLIDCILRSSLPQHAELSSYCKSIITNIGYYLFFKDLFLRNILSKKDTLNFTLQYNFDTC